MGTKHTMLIIFSVFILMFVSYQFGRCSKKPIVVIKEVMIPQIEGSSELIVDPEPLISDIKKSIIYKDSIITHDKEFDDEMVLKFAGLTSEYDKLKTYISAIENNVYSIPIDNEFYSTNNHFTIQGKLIDFKQDFIIKERKVTIDIEVPKHKERIFSIYAGGGLKTTTSLDGLEPTMNLILQSKNGNLIGVQYGLDDSIFLSYSKRIFEYKK